MNTPTESRNEALVKKGHPSGLYMLFMVEMWERFNYYGMRALLTLFMVSSVIGFDEKKAFKIYGWFTALVYLTPIIGGYIADKYIGKRHSVTIGAIIMAIGQFTLASYGFIPAQTALYLGLTFIIIGNGFFKPNISTIVGELYEPNDPRRDGAFTIFYMGINLGAFIAPFLTGYVGEVTATSPSWVQWRWGFMVAGIGMIIGLIWYLVSQKKYLGDIGLYPAGKTASSTEVDANRPLTEEEKDKMKAIFIFTFFAVFFFAFFEQAGSSLSIFASESTNRMVYIPFLSGAYEIKASWFQSVNPIFVIILAPLFAKFWINLSAKDKEPSTPVKFGWGLFLLGLGYLVIAGGAALLVGGKGLVNMYWLVALYFLHTCGELCLSPVGLSMVTKLAPAKFMSILMGVWLASSFLGNILGGYIAGLSTDMSMVSFFLLPGISAIAFSAIIWLMSGKIKSWMHGIN